MNVFKLGLRNIIGITFPGAILIIAALYVLISFCYLLNIPLEFLNILTSQQLILFVILFVISYIIGSILRLESADNLDDKSSEYMIEEYFNEPPGDFTSKEKLYEIRKKLLNGNNFISVPPFFDKWIWRVEKFPYTLWELRKFKIYHPPEVSNFFKSYESCFGIGSKVHDTGRKGKEFFNYCKMVITHSCKDLGDSLKEEVYLAEAMTRFYAGTYVAANISFYFILVLSVALFLSLALEYFGIIDPVQYYATHNFIFSLFLVTLFTLVNKNIAKRFRKLRLKEVDTVYDAFYLVHRHADHCPQCSKIPSYSEDTAFKERTNLLEEVFKRSQKDFDNTNPLQLESLISAMKEKSKVNKYLSSIYFAGKDGDHPYSIQNDKIAVGISVLPEDKEKSYVSKYHEHQQEIIVVIDGTILLELKTENGISENVLNQGDVFVIEKKQCHRISSVKDQDAAFMFIKTNPAHEPRSNDCKIINE